MDTQVRVLVAGIYNGPGHRALPWAEVGAVIEVADAEYADRLVAAGLVSRESGDAPLVIAPGPAETQVAAGPRARKRKP
jgi:hypothetical protein